MSSRLRIVWDGDVPGLLEHRLSLASFGPALSSLLEALRRIASGLLTEAWDDPDHGTRGGRIARAVEGLDLQLSGLKDGSVDVTASCLVVDAPSQRDLFLASITDRSLAAFLGAVRDESRGTPKNAKVRKYLAQLPKGLKYQKYVRYEGDVEIETVEVGDVTLPDEPLDTPYLTELRGEVVGVGFETGKCEVRIKIQDKTVACTATAAQVETALSLRDRPVVALAVTSARRPRLLWLRDQSEVVPPPRADTVSIAVFAQWDELLRRLSK